MTKIKGIQKTSMIDYPGKICTILFTAGCNFRCPFCYNSSLVQGHETLPEIPHHEILEFLDSRKKWIDGVCITGGEPLLNNDIDLLLKKIKDLDLLVKLDTNGTNPKLLKKLLENKLIDYIAMDIKNSFAKYSLTTGSKVDIEEIKESIKIIKNSGIEYEFRLTTLKKFHSDEDLQKISESLKGSKNFYLQNFKVTPELIDKNLDEEECFSGKELENFKHILEKNIEHVEIRNI